MYPDARRDDVVEVLHGRAVPDPYRWLEDAAVPETVAWSGAQAELFAAHRATWHSREAFKERLRRLTSVGMVSAPHWAGGRRFFLRREPGQDHPVLYADDRVLVDPNALDPGGATTLDHWYPSHEGDRLAYAVSLDGSEEPSLWVLDVGTGEVIDGPIGRMRDPSVAWLPGGRAFYYTRFLEHTEDGQPWLHRRVYLHTVGDSCNRDVLIMGQDAPRGRYFAPHVSDDGRWLCVFERQGTDPRRDIWLADLTGSDPAAPTLKPLQVGVDALTTPIPLGDKVFLLTDRDAPRGRVCVAPAADLSYGSWRELTAADADSVLTAMAVLDGAFVLTRSRHAVSELSLHDDQTGRLLAAVPLPGLGTTGQLTTDPADRSAAWLSYTDFSTVPVILRLDGPTRTLSEYDRPPGGVPAVPLDVRQVAYHSKDGTRIRMFVVSKPDAPEGPRPTILYGYGGFNISLTPEYKERLIAWVEAGGVYAIASLRGGSEEGEQWHRAGMHGCKQNVFDDFHAAGDWLVEKGVTTRDLLAISGGSNGGLLVGAAVTQRPDAYAAVVCSAPLLDMVRYELFGLGMTWSGEYGTVADPSHFAWLHAYSPYHNVRDGVTYPPVLLVAFDGDSRVDPLHARKMTAALQHVARAAGGGPILLRAEAHVGHGARAVSRMVELAADELAFISAAVSPQRS